MKRPVLDFLAEEIPKQFIVFHTTVLSKSNSQGKFQDFGQARESFADSHCGSVLGSPGFSPGVR